MKFAAFSLIIATSAFAQTLISSCLSTAVAIPSCGIQVLLSIATTYGCGATDFRCQCEHQGQISSAAFSPVISACNVQTAYEVEQSALALCSCVDGKPFPGSSAASGTSSPASVTAAGTTAGASIAATKAGSSVAAAQTTAAQSSSISNVGQGSSSQFKGAAAAASAIAPAAGMIGAVAGLMAYL